MIATRALGRTIAPLVIGAALSGCAVPFVDAPDPGNGPMADRIFVRNGSSGQLVVTINGRVAGAVLPLTDGAVPFAGHDGPPFRIEVRSQAGTLLLEQDISVADFQATAAGSSEQGSGTDSGCGWVSMAYGSPDLNDPVPGEPLPTPGGPCS